MAVTKTQTVPSNGKHPPAPTATPPRDVVPSSARQLAEKRRQQAREEPAHEEPPPVSNGAVEKALDLAFNPTREKLREVTIIDRAQGRLFPMLDVINKGQQYCLEIAIYRQSPEQYRTLFNKERPIMPNLLDELLYRTAQWQKSVQGTNLTKITDIALAETETRTDDGGDSGGVDAWGKE